MMEGPEWCWNDVGALELDLVKRGLVRSSFSAFCG